MNVHDKGAHKLPQEDGTRHPVRRLLLWGLGALAFVALGAAGAVLVLHVMGALPLERVATILASATATPAIAPVPALPAAETSPPIEVMLTPEAVRLAGIKTAPATLVDASITTQLPGSVLADAYREGKVTPIAGGIVTKIHVELGAVVKRGARLATLFSPELAETQTKYLSRRAMRTAAYQKLQRLQQLVELGAASRQELDEVAATHASYATEVEAARQRLLLLGLSQSRIDALTSPQQIVSEITVPAPLDGVITGRTAHLGQVVSMGQELFVVTDLSQVWIIGDLYEQDFGRISVGTDAVLTTPAYPTQTFRGRVTYIDPRVDPQTRTAKVRVEVPNPAGRLRLGMYMTMTFTTHSGARQLVVPRTAVQTMGTHQVVFVPAADAEGTFVQRTVQVGGTQGEFVTILEGVTAGETVVTEGSFFLRAESLRNAPAG